MAFAKGSAVCIVVLTPYEIIDRPCPDLGDTVVELVWAGPWTVAARLESKGVVLVEANGSPRPRSLPIPDEATFARPPPRGDDGGVQFGADPSTKTHLFARGEEVWLARCPWWFGFDAGWCHEWVSARLHPSPKVEVSTEEPPGLHGAPELAFEAAPPDDVAIRIVTGDAENPPELVCERGEHRAAFVPPGPSTNVDIDWTWIAESTSKYLATVEYDYGEAILYKTFLLNACDDTATVELSAVQTGPAAYWIHLDGEGWLVRSGDQEIGRIDGDLPTFAPSDAASP